MGFIVTEIVQDLTEERLLSSFTSCKFALLSSDLSLTASLTKMYCKRVNVLYRMLKSVLNRENIYLCKNKGKHVGGLFYFGFLGGNIV